jgi:4-amino-4-deoxy-L-arabinose transferase-like glycosyltransferase
MIRARSRKVLVLGLALAVGLTLRVWFIQHSPKVTGDSLVYGDIAKNWLRHGVYGFSKNLGARPTLLRLPGYPIFLAACFAVFGVDHYGAPMFVQAFVDIGTCLLAAGLAGRLYGPRAWWLALWLAVLCPFTANYTGAALTETLSLLCVAAAFHAVVRWRDAGLGLNRWILLAGSSMAYAVLLRPEQGLLAAAVVPAMAWMAWSNKKALAPVVVAAVLVVLPLGPWAIRNWVTFHVVQPLAPRNANDPGELVPVGFQRWYRTWGVDFISTDQVYWHYDTDPILVTDLPARAFDSPEQKKATAQLLDEYNQTTTATAAFDARFNDLAEQRIQHSPLRYYLGMPLGRLTNMLLRPRTELINVPLDWWKGGKLAWVSILLGTINLLYFVLAACGIGRSGIGGAVGWGMLAFCLLRCALLATIDNSEPRYTLELFPLIVVWGSGILGRAIPSSPSTRV